MPLNPVFRPPESEDGTNSLGSTRGHYWKVNKSTVDMTVDAVPPRKITISAEPQNVVCDLNQTALVIIDMQNDFCTQDGWVDAVGLDYRPDRRPIEPLTKLIPELRKQHVPIIWVNWGNRPDLMNMPPNQLHLYSQDGEMLGLGEPLPANGAHVLEKDSWAAAVVDELEIKPEDIRVDKYRISGFWDTPLDSILRNLNIRTIMFAGVNTDQCVMCSLQDANFLGYGCILVDDCCATSSPDFCTEATIWNVKNCYGFVTSSTQIIDALDK